MFDFETKGREIAEGYGHGTDESERAALSDAIAAGMREAAAAEKEACARIAGGFAARVVAEGESVCADVIVLTAQAIEREIRARGPGTVT